MTGPLIHVFNALIIIIIFSLFVFLVEITLSLYLGTATLQKRTSCQQ